MALPSLDAVLKAGVPVVVCARPWAKDLLAAYELAGFIPMRGSWSKDYSRVAAYRQASGHTTARGLLLPDSLSSALVFTLARVPSAGYRDDGRSLLLRWPIRKPDQTLHAVESWYWLTTETLRRWSLAAPTAPLSAQLELSVAPQFEQQGRLALRDAGLEENRYVLIAPTATGLHRGKIKVWPHFNALTRSLQQRGITVVMCPPPSEVEEARANAPTAMLLDPLNLPAFATLARLASLVVCNDSGVSHIAAAAGARQLTLFGVTDQGRTGPWSPAAVCLGSSAAWPSVQEVLDQTLDLLAPNQP